MQVRINLPNGDMVGHTGDIETTVVACKAADEAVKVRTNKRKYLMPYFLFLFSVSIYSENSYVMPYHCFVFIISIF